MSELPAPVTEPAAVASTVPPPWLPPRWWPVATLALVAMVAAGAALAWRADQRVSQLEQELVRRQQDSADSATEARVLARAAEEAARDNAAKVALLEARLGELAAQRGQFEELILSLSRSRDENLVVDVEAAIRLAWQHTFITGSAEPLVATLKQSDERLARQDPTRLESVRRAIARDLDRVKSASTADVPSLGIKLDEAVRLVDEMPLLGVATLRGDHGRVPAQPPRPAAPASAAAGSAFWQMDWFADLADTWDRWTERAWSEARALVRVTHIDRPEAMLLAPEQAFFLRENLKLRLLNARLALLSRQFDTTQADLQSASATIERYFDRGSRRTSVALDLLKQVAAQARQVAVPRPDDTFAALTALTASAVPR